MMAPHIHVEGEWMADCAGCLDDDVRYGAVVR